MIRSHRCAYTCCFWCVLVVSLHWHQISVLQSRTCECKNPQITQINFGFSHIRVTPQQTIIFQRRFSSFVSPVFQHQFAHSALCVITQFMLNSSTRGHVETLSLVHVCRHMISFYVWPRKWSDHKEMCILFLWSLRFDCCTTSNNLTDVT